MRKKFIPLFIVAFILGSIITVSKLITAPPKTSSSKAQELPSNLVDPNFDSVQSRIIAGFPTFPIYPGAKIKESRKEKGAQESIKGYTGLWEVGVNNNVADIVSWYKTNLAEEGWSVQSSGENASLTEDIIQANKGDVSVVIIIEMEDTESIDILVNIPL